MSGGIGAPCGLCGVCSAYLVATQWGAVCRPCLRAKSRAAVRGASVPAAVPESTQGLPGGPQPYAPGGAYDGPCACGEPLQRVRLDTGALMWWHTDPAVAARCPSMQTPETRARDEALREEGRLEGERRATEGAVQYVLAAAQRYDDNARLSSPQGLTAQLHKRSAYALRVVAEGFQEGRHLTKEGG